jgi:hypothetical protein
MAHHFVQAERHGYFSSISQCKFLHECPAFYHFIYLRHRSLEVHNNVSTIRPPVPPSLCLCSTLT